LFDPDEEDAKLAEALEPLHEDGMEKGYAIANKIGIDVAFDMEAPGLKALAGKLAGRVTGINATTKDALDAQINEGLRRGYSTMQISQGVEDENYQGVEGVFEQAKGYRAEMIARTETMTAYNSATLDAYAVSEQVDEVEVLDGTDDPECADMNGQTFPLDEAEGLMDDEHPNGTRAFAPVVKQWLPKDTKVLRTRLKEVTALLDQTLARPVEVVVNVKPTSVRAPDVYVTASSDVDMSGVVEAVNGITEAVNGVTAESKRPKLERTTVVSRDGEGRIEITEKESA
jgi:hypothetical protein